MLFKDTNKLLEYAQINGTVNFPAVKSTIQMVEEEYLLPIVGKSQYDDLNDAYKTAVDESALSAPQKKLLEKCRAVVGPYFTYLYAQGADVQVSDGGIRRSETANVKTAYQYQVRQFLDHMLHLGGISTEALIRFLEENKSDYTMWSASDEFTQYRSTFIKSGREFNQFFSSATPYRNYIAMRPKMVDVEMNAIQPLLGDTLYQSLKTKDQADQDFTAAEKELLVRIKYAIAALTVAHSVPVLNVRIDAAGLSLISQTPSSTSDAVSSRSNADANAINHFIQSTENSGRQWMEAAKKYMKAHPADFTTWPGNMGTSNETKAKTHHVHGLY